MKLYVLYSKVGNEDYLEGSFITREAVNWKEQELAKEGKQGLHIEEIETKPKGEGNPKDSNIVDIAPISHPFGLFPFG